MVPASVVDPYILAQADPYEQDAGASSADEPPTASEPTDLEDDTGPGEALKKIMPVEEDELVDRSLHRAQEVTSLDRPVQAELPETHYGVRNIPEPRNIPWVLQLTNGVCVRIHADGCLNVTSLAASVNAIEAVEATLTRVLEAQWLPKPGRGQQDVSGIWHCWQQMCVSTCYTRERSGWAHAMPWVTSAVIPFPR